MIGQTIPLQPRFARHALSGFPDQKRPCRGIPDLSTFERGDALRTDNASRTDLYREHVFDRYKDLARPLDYIQTRSELDSNRVAYYGLSWVAALGPVFSVTEPCTKTALWIGGGFGYEETFPEVDPINFLTALLLKNLLRC